MSRAAQAVEQAVRALRAEARKTNQGSRRTRVDDKPTEPNDLIDDRASETAQHGPLEDVTDQLNNDDKHPAVPEDEDATMAKTTIKKPVKAKTTKPAKPVTKAAKAAKPAAPKVAGGARAERNRVLFIRGKAETVSVARRAIQLFIDQKDVTQEDRAEAEKILKRIKARA